jgi:glycosyltransferase involved in cell wall biosynthesis
MMKKIKILYQIPGPLSPIDSGSKKRILGMLEYFRTHSSLLEVDLVSRNPYSTEPWDQSQINFVRSYFNHIYIYQGQKKIIDFLESRIQSFWFQKVLRSQMPINTHYHTPYGYKEYFDNLLSANQYDYVWINYLDSWALVTSEKASSIRKIIDIHDISCRIRLVRKNVAHLKNLRFNYESNFRKEIKTLRNFDHILVNSTDEIAELQPHLNKSQLTLVPHILSESNHADYKNRRMQYDLLFVGTSYAPNIEGIFFFLTQIFPRIIENVPTVRLALVGNICNLVNIPNSVKNNIVCLGFVPDLSKIYLSSRIVICPLLSGSGTKVKLQEAIAYGIPIVTTSVGASGLALQDGVNAFIKDQPDVFIESLNRLLESKELAGQHSLNLIQTFQENYAETVVHGKLDRILVSNTSPSIQPLIHA